MNKQQNQNDMKRIYLTFISTILSILIYGQDFAPIGAEWYYNEQFAFSGDVDYIKFNSEKDTLVNGQTCKKITKRHKLGCNDRPDTEYLYTKNDTVFFLDTIFNEFQILYVFNANPLDSWIIKIKDEEQDLDTILISVDSITTKQINGVDLKAIHVTYNKFDENMPETYSSTIIEKIGDVKYMFNWYPWSNVACDVNYTSGLRCYQDSQLGLYSTGIADSCDYTYKWTGIDKNELNSRIQIFPNPANDYIEIILDINSDYKAELYDLNGRLLLTKIFNLNIELDLVGIKSGYYLLMIKEKTEILGSRRLIKI